ncbi:hypothetical protein AGMMS49587_05360 [Spirochaetia bacterium]|nr:hypothetical protein AGMMS49587_05360 [Spirochaetia bacterium]
MTNFLFRNKTTSVITVVICIIVVSGQFAVSALKNFTTKLVEEKAAWIESIIVEEVPDNKLITEGVPVSFIPEAIGEARSLLPAEIPIDIAVVDRIVNDYYQKLVDRAFSQIEGKISIIERHRNENNMITLHSIMTALKEGIFSYLNRVYLIARLVILGILLIYAGCCAYTAYRGRQGAIPK